MLIRRSLLLPLSVLAIVLVGPSTASAVEIGNRCVATTGNTTATWVEATSPAYTIPFSGIITKWGSAFSGPAPPFPIELISVRGTAPNFTVTAKSDAGSLVPGQMTFSTRINVVAGDRIAVTNTPLGCASPGNSIETLAGTVVANNQAFTTTSTSPGTALAVWAQLEADVDGDGFGDETQDLCPQSAQIQATCPVPKLGIARLPYSKGFQAVATTDFATTITVTGSVKLPGKRKATTFKSKAFKTTPGLLTKISLKLPASVTKALKGLSRSKKLKVTFTATADGVVTDATKKYTVSFPGTKR